VKELERKRETFYFLFLKPFLLSRRTSHAGNMNPEASFARRPRSFPSFLPSATCPFREEETLLSLAHVLP